MQFVVQRNTLDTDIGRILKEAVGDLDFFYETTLLVADAEGVLAALPD